MWKNGKFSLNLSLTVVFTLLFLFAPLIAYSADPPSIKNVSVDFSQIPYYAVVSGENLLNKDETPGALWISGEIIETYTSQSSTQLSVILPASISAPGTYLLTLLTDKDQVDFEVAIGAVGPQGEQGEQGPQGDTGLQGPPGITPQEIANLIARIEVLESNSQNRIWEGDLSIKTSEDIAMFCSNGYEEVEGDVIINSSMGSGLSNLDGLGCLRRIGGGLYIYGGYNSPFTNIDGISNLLAVKKILISNVPIRDLEAFSHITEIDLLWINNTYIRETLGLRNLKSANTFIISKNKYLVSLWLPELRTVNNTLTIDGNELLDSIGAFQNCQVYNLKIIDSPNITTLSHSYILKKIGAIVNPIITIVNTGLNDLNGLEEYAVGSFRNIEITNNENIVNISSLNEIEYLKGDLIITDNIQLPTTSQAIALRDSIGVENISGEILIYGNMPDPLP